MRSAIVGLRSAGIAWPGILVWHHSGPLKCPKKGWKPLKSAFLGTLKPPMLPKSIFFLPYASSYVSWKCIRCKIHHIGALNHPRSPLGTFWTLKTAHFGPLEQLTSFKVFFYQIKSFFYSKCIKVRPINMNFILKVPKKTFKNPFCLLE